MARWTLSAAVSAIAAGALATASPGTTHCYAGVRTQDPATTDPSPHTPRCFSVANGLFTSVFTPPELLHDTPHSPRFAIPGLWDGHGHMLQYGEFLHSVDLFGARTLAHVMDRIAAYVEAHPGAGTRDNWIRGVGWDQNAYGRMPTAKDIDSDQRLAGLYIMLDRVDVHCKWVSAPVLALLPPDLPTGVLGGEIVRDPGMGVFCDAAMDFVVDHYPQPGPEVRRAFYRTAMASLNQLGLVGMHDAGVTPKNIRILDDMAAAGEATVRNYAMLECEDFNQFCPHEAVRIDRDDGMLTVRSVKIFGDGALGSWGSAMLEPYSDRPDASGSLLLNATQLTTITNQWAQAGYQVNIHAIGDLTNRLVINAMESALDRLCPVATTTTTTTTTEPPAARIARLHDCQSRHRFRIEHAQIIHPDDQTRMRQLGIIPSIQPTHATSDMGYAELRLGAARARSSAYRMRSVLDLAPVLGSDFPVEPASPFRGLYAALTRRSPATGQGAPANPAAGWLPDETLTLDQALRGFTLNVARAAFLDGRAGAIRPGAFADWVVLEQPLDEVPVEGLRELKVVETWVAGRRVYARDEHEQTVVAAAAARQEAPPVEFGMAGIGEFGSNIAEAV